MDAMYKSMSSLSEDGKYFICFRNESASKYCEDQSQARRDSTR